MASGSRDLKSHLTDIVTCPICHELFDSPKSLPCLHTFCLKCIEGHCSDKQRNDAPSCPVCRQKFTIPDSGVQGLVSNFLIADLLEARKTPSDEVLGPAVAATAAAACEVCLLVSNQDGSRVAVSTMYCVDCSQKLCDGCSRPHRTWKDGPHSVVPVWKEIEMDLIQTLSGRCDKHKNDESALYCLDCKMNLCVSCFTAKHQQHKCYYTGTVTARCVEQADADMELVKRKADVTRNEISRTEEDRRKFLAGVQDVGEKILERGEELKQHIDRQVIELMAEVQVLKTEKCKVIDSHKEIIEAKLLALETFNSNCSELKAKGEPCDVTRAANDLHTRATELLQDDVTPPDYCAPVVTFKPVNIHELLADGQNLVGVVYPNQDIAVGAAHVTHTLAEAQDVWGVTSLGDELYVLRSKGEINQVEVYKSTTAATTTTTTSTTTTSTYSLLRQLSVPALKRGVDMASCKHYRCLYISDHSSTCVHRVKLNGKAAKWSVKEAPWCLSVTSQFTVVVSCSDVAILLEYTTKGKQLREINLHPHIPKPWHGIRLSEGQFVVGHGSINDHVNRVCIVDTNGHVTQSYGGPPGSAADGLLCVPVHLAVDENRFIYVADIVNRRVLLLSPTLSFVREIVSSDQLKWDPIRLFLDVDRRRLFVSDSAWGRGSSYRAGRIVVLQL